MKVNMAGLSAGEVYGFGVYTGTIFKGAYGEAAVAGLRQPMMAFTNLLSARWLALPVQNRSPQTLLVFLDALTGHDLIGLLAQSFIDAGQKPPEEQACRDVPVRPSVISRKH